MSPAQADRRVWEGQFAYWLERDHRGVRLIARSLPPTKDFGRDTGAIWQDSSAMDFVDRPLPFVLAASAHGSLIVNRNDYRMVDAQRGYGVGFQILGTSGFDPQEVTLALALLKARQLAHGSGVEAVDCGANIGVHTVEWARFMHGWGRVTAIEAQERIFYALAGNIAINNCLNAHALHAAASSAEGHLEIPEPDYLQPSSFGSLELKPRADHEFIGQKIDYEKTRRVRTVTIDGLGLARADFLKIDVEGMEFEVLEGAARTLAAFHPILLVEAVKVDRDKLQTHLGSQGYSVINAGLNVLAIHGADPALNHIRLT